MSCRAVIPAFAMTSTRRALPSKTFVSITFCAATARTLSLIAPFDSRSAWERLLIRDWCLAAACAAFCWWEASIDRPTPAAARATPHGPPSAPISPRAAPPRPTPIDRASPDAGPSAARNAALICPRIGMRVWSTAIAEPIRPTDCSCAAARADCTRICSPHDRYAPTTGPDTVPARRLMTGATRLASSMATIAVCTGPGSAPKACTSQPTPCPIGPRTSERPDAPALARFSAVVTMSRAVAPAPASPVTSAKASATGDRPSPRFSRMSSPARPALITTLIAEASESNARSFNGPPKPPAASRIASKPSAMAADADGFASVYRSCR